MLNSLTINGSMRARGEHVKKGESLDPIQRAFDRKEPYKAWMLACREVELTLGLPANSIRFTPLEFEVNSTKEQMMNLLGKRGADMLARHYNTGEI